MARPFRVLRPAHKCQTPIESLQLGEDVMRVRLMRQILKDIDCGSVCKNRRDGKDELALLAQKLKLWEKLAWERLRTEFLAVEPDQKN